MTDPTLEKIKRPGLRERVGKALVSAPKAVYDMLVAIVGPSTWAIILCMFRHAIAESFGMALAKWFDWLSQRWFLTVEGAIARWVMIIASVVVGLHFIKQLINLFREPAN